MEVSLLGRTPTAEDIEAFQAVAIEDAQVPLVVVNHFAPGLYVREMRIPAGHYVVGARHKTEHLVAFIGDMEIWTEGDEQRISGQQIAVSHPGAKRIGYAHSDSTYSTIHANPDDCRDVAELESRFVVEAEQLQYRRLALEAA